MTSSLPLIDKLWHPPHSLSPDLQPRLHSTLPVLALDSLALTSTLDSQTTLHLLLLAHPAQLATPRQQFLDAVEPRHLAEVGLPPQTIARAAPPSRHGILPREEWTEVRVGERMAREELLVRFGNRAAPLCLHS